MTDSAIIIFARNPELGKVKTRLAKTIGDTAALNIYKFLVQHTVNITKNIPCQKFVYYTNFIDKTDVWDANIYQKKIQSGATLGERMHNAFKDVLNSYNKAIIIGTDMLALRQEDIEKAFNALETNHAVIGPALDGGYYLLGLKNQIPKGIFNNKQWSTETVLKDTLNDLKNHNVYLLDVKNDIDTYDDIKDIDILQSFIKK